MRACDLSLKQCVSENEELKRQVSGLRLDLQLAEESVVRVQSDKTELIRELYGKLEAARAQVDHLTGEASALRQEWAQKSADLKFELETVSDRCDYYRGSYETARQEQGRLEADIKGVRSQALSQVDAAERHSGKLKSENDKLRAKCQDLQLQLESQFLVFDAQAHEQKRQMRE